MDYAEQETETIRTYDQYAASWAGDHSNMSHSLKMLDEFRRLLPKGVVLEIGAGHGVDGRMLKDAGYGYLGTDAAAGMINIARNKYPDLELEALNVYDLQSLGRTFDGVWANAVLLHIPKERMDEALDTVSNVLKAGGVGLISLKDGDKQEFERREVSGRQENRIFTYWRKEEFETILGRHGFMVVGYSYDHKSERSKWHRFFIQKIK